MNKRRSWQYWGRFFGYPTCCIDHFEKRGLIFKCERNPLSGTGFVPCPKCVNKGAYQLIEEINNRRVCAIPFKLD